ncbi:MAG: hypothetical protein IKF07_06800 [Eubacterium sp.]|nr:hypothetical protein [Eubacterium sp.]
MFSYRKTGMCAALIIVLMLFAASFLTAQTAYADDKTAPDWNKAVTVYVNMTMYDEFVQGGGSSFALEPVTVPYFDLANYDLEYLYYNENCYAESGGVPFGNFEPGTKETADGIVTMLHLFIYITEVYRNGVSPSDAGTGWLADNDWKDLTFSGNVGSIFFSPTFWDYTGGDLNYYLNYEYPFGYPGLGATADQIALTNGDVVSVKNTPYGSEDDIGTFYHFGENALIDQEVDQNSTITLSLYKVEMDDFMFPTETIHSPADEGCTVSVVNAIGGNAIVSGTTDSDGEVTLDTSSLEPGMYYVISDTFAPAVMYLAVKEDPSAALDAAKAAAKTELASYKDPSLYRDAQKTELTQLIAKWNALIDAADSTSAVNSALVSAKAEIDGIKTDAMLLAEEKTAAKNELSSYKDPSLYRDAQKTELAAAISSGKSAIDAAQTTAGVNSALAAAKKEIDKIKTDAQMAIEEGNLEEAKKAAKAELSKYKDPSLYRDPQKEELIAAINKGIAEIDAAKDTNDVASVLLKAEREIDKIKTDADLLKEEKEAAKEELSKYKDPSLYEDAQKEELANAIARGNTMIDAAKNTEEVNSALAAAKAEIDLIKVDDDKAELDAAKKAAKTELASYEDASLYRDAQKEELAAAINRGNAAIEAAGSKDEVASALKAAKDEIDTIKTDAEINEALDNAAIKAAKAAKPKISAKAMKKGKAKISWKKITLKYTAEGVEETRPVSGYRVYRSTKKNGKYKRVKTIKKGSTVKFTDKKLKKGKVYYYKVSVFTKIDGTHYNGKMSRAVKVKAK